MKNKRLETYQEMKNLEKACKITKEEVWSERERGVWEINWCRQIERDRRNENRIAKKVCIDLQQISIDAGVEEAIEVGIEEMVFDN